jgi:hypothetical protein
MLGTFPLMLPLLSFPKLKQENHQQRSKSANQDFRQSSSFDSYQSLCIILFCTFAPLTLKNPFFSKNQRFDKRNGDRSTNASFGVIK